MLTHYDLEMRKQVRNDFSSTIVVQKGSAYSSGEIIGGLIKIDNEAGIFGPNRENGLSAILQSLVLIDPDGKSSSIDFVFFNSIPETEMTDAASFAPGANDLSKIIGIVSILNTDYVSVGGSVTVAAGKNLSNIGRVLKPQDTTAIYCVPVSRGAPTYTDNDLIVRFQFSNGL